MTLLACCGSAWLAFSCVMSPTTAGGLSCSVETTVGAVGCGSCGTRARARDRRRVRLRDAPIGDRPVLIEWHKRVWSCPESDCATNTWTEQRPGLAGARRVLTARAARWVCDRVRALEGTPASCARSLGVSWSTVWTAVVEHGGPLVDDEARVGDTVMVGVDETVMQPAHRRRRGRFVTAVVDVTTSQILDVFEGRDARDLQAWLASMPRSWRDAIRVVSVDPHEGYRSAITNTRLLREVTMVVDPFHIVRLANMALTRCRQRAQQATFGHRGWKGDPLYGSRKLFLLGAERVNEAGWERLWSALRDGDPAGEVQDAWVAKEKVRDVYLTDDPNEPPSRSTTRSLGAAQSSRARNCDASPKRCDAGAQRSSPTTRRARATARSRQPTSWSNRSSVPVAGSATSPTTDCASCSPAVSRANVTPSRDFELVPAQSRRATKGTSVRRERQPGLDPLERAAHAPRRSRRLSDHEHSMSFR